MGKKQRKETKREETKGERKEISGNLQKYAKTEKQGK